jgi:predicted glycoside hydrolase/deacetylase ChbG (UPF0249 family)
MLPLTVCADDYGLSPGVSRGILQCLERGSISATSCMSGSPYWRDWAPRLRSFLNDADIGLHFTLTDQTALAPLPRLAPDGRFPTVRRLAGLALEGALDASEIESELVRQLDAFEQALGAPPSHVDGHHHVHQFPTVRAVLVDTLKKRYGARPPYVRVARDRASRILRRGVAVGRAVAVGFFGGALRRLVDAAGVGRNEGFCGIYDFGPRRLERMYAAFLRAPGERMLMLCHPGVVDRELCQADHMTEPRERELAFFLGPEWPRIVQGSGLRIGRLNVAGPLGP